MIIVSVRPAVHEVAELFPNEIVVAPSPLPKSIVLLAVRVSVPLDANVPATPICNMPPPRENEEAEGNAAVAAYLRVPAEIVVEPV